MALQTEKGHWVTSADDRSVSPRSYQTARHAVALTGEEKLITQLLIQ